MQVSHQIARILSDTGTPQARNGQRQPPQRPVPPVALKQSSRLQQRQGHLDLQRDVEDLGNVVLEEHLGQGSRVIRLMADRMNKSHALSGIKLRYAWESTKLPRGEAVARLTASFDAHKLRDDWLASTINILDAVGGVRNVADIWAASLLILKQQESQVELGVPLKNIIFKLACVQTHSQVEFWKSVTACELRICQLLDFQLLRPTSLDLAMWLVANLTACAVDVSWTGFVMADMPAPRGATRSRVPRYALLAYYLIELGVTSEAFSELLFGPGSLVSLALAAIQTSFELISDPAPECLKQAVGEWVAELLPETLQKRLPSLSRVLRHLADEGTSKKSAVVSKWFKRAQLGLLGGPSPWLSQLSSSSARDVKWWKSPSALFDAPETPRPRGIRELTWTPSREQLPGCPAPGQSPACPASGTWAGSWSAFMWKGDFIIEDGHLCMDDQKVQIHFDRDPVEINWPDNGPIQKCMWVDTRRGAVAWRIGASGDELEKYLWVKWPGKLKGQETVEPGFAWEGRWRSFLRLSSLDVRNGTFTKCSGHVDAKLLEEPVQLLGKWLDGSTTQTTKSAHERHMIWKGTDCFEHLRKKRRVQP